MSLAEGANRVFMLQLNIVILSLLLLSLGLGSLWEGEGIPRLIEEGEYFVTKDIPTLSFCTHYSLF